MKRIKKIEIDGKEIYLSKGLYNWKVVYPFQKKYNNGKINWKYLVAGSSWLNLLKIMLIIGLILGCIYEYSNAVNLANKCLENPFFIGGILP